MPIISLGIIPRLRKAAEAGKQLEIAIAFNRIYTPILRQQVSEITDFFLPMEALSYKVAIISIDKAYPGQARRAALAFWSALPQFTYQKLTSAKTLHRRLKIGITNK